MNRFYDNSATRRFSFPSVMHAAAFVCALLNIVLSPWCFGSWEMWWFWPMAALLFAGCLFAGIGTLLEAIMIDDRDDTPRSDRPPLAWSAIIAAVAFVPFLVYALVRAHFPSAPGLPLVAMETERSLLLFFTPAALALIMALSFTRRRLAVAAWIVFANITIIAIYAIVGTLAGYVDYVLWVESPWTYGGRAKAVFFCPNHLSAYMNLGICLALALVFAPRTGWRVKVVAVLAAFAMAWADFLTLSRGGLASLLLGLAIGLPILAMRGRQLWARLLAPILLAASLAGAVFAIWHIPNPLMERVSAHPLYKSVAENWGAPELKTRIHDSFWYSFDRGTYIQSALRAWKSNPVWGIGPGQHSNRWQEFNPTDPGVPPVDGDPATMKRPRYVNYTQHLYEVHSDWTQLLEEYGVVGFVLFAIPILILFVVLCFAQSSMNADAPRPAGVSSPAILRALPLAALLAFIVMSIHSLGDFSFQMPSITWLFTFLAAGGVLSATRSDE
ncbi:MAG: O-antigen ligase family protein [Kiritimatiellia bacterium]|jgi:O-antigen ligase